MTNTIEVEYNASAPAIAEGIRVAGAWMLGKAQPLHTIATLLVTVLIGIGGAGVAFALALAATGTPEAATWYIWIGPIVAIVFFISVQNWPIRRLSHYAAQSTYCTGTQTATFDPTGMNIRNQHSHWQTDWAAVEQIRLGKKGVIISVAGLGYVVPRAALTDAEALEKQLQSWKNTQ